MSENFPDADLVSRNFHLRGKLFKISELPYFWSMIV